MPRHHHTRVTASSPSRSRSRSSSLSKRVQQHAKKTSGAKRAGADDRGRRSHHRGSSDRHRSPAERKHRSRESEGLLVGAAERRLASALHAGGTGTLKAGGAGASSKSDVGRAVRQALVATALHSQSSSLTAGAGSATKHVAGAGSATKHVYNGLSERAWNRVLAAGSSSSRPEARSPSRSRSASASASEHRSRRTRASAKTAGGAPAKLSQESEAGLRRSIEKRLAGAAKQISAAVSKNRQREPSRGHRRHHSGESRSGGHRH